MNETHVEEIRVSLNREKSSNLSNLFFLYVLGETLPYDNIQEIRALLNQV